ncbi:MAG: DNA-directed RNA polymerase subunit D [Candidatus Micrarchaeia archaeon]|jgi:DNA-directed RNA polymerase subunit D
MKLQIIKSTPQKLTIKISDASPAFVNALRRTIITDLPSFAIDEVDFFENNSPMYNEYIANRLALIPLYYDEDAADDAKIAFALDKEGPCTVYSKDLKSADEKIRVFCQNIPIIKLGEKQRLRLEAIAVKGTMRQHAKFQCALASYNAFPEITVKKGGALKAGVDACPRKVFNEKGEPTNLEACDLCNACTDAAPENFQVKPSATEFIFFVETYNNISPKEHLNKALEIMSSRAKALAKEL